MARAALAFWLLLAVWLLWSGHTEPLVLGFGVASCAFVAWISARLGVLDALPPAGFALRTLAYGPWLLFEIAKSNVAVARVILSPSLPISPRLVRVRASQRTSLGQVTYANSVTLTPGTTTLDLRDDHLLVHALTEAAARDLESGDMDRRVRALEGTA